MFAEDDLESSSSEEEVADIDGEGDCAASTSSSDDGDLDEVGTGIVERFLVKALQPPQTIAVRRAIKLLQDIGALK